MQGEWADIVNVSKALADRFGPPPSLVVVLGSGLGAFREQLSEVDTVDYPSLGLPPCGVAGHAGTLSVGRLEDKRVAVLAGRWHLYEGHPVATAVRGVRALRHWGARGLILSSAVGGIDPRLAPGDLCLVSDHINLSGQNPLQGANLDELGPRFPDLSSLYTPSRRTLARSIDPSLHEVVYGAMPGPSYETPAEIQMLLKLGAGVVGMSLVHEAIAAGHAGMEVLAVTVVSNLAAGISPTPLHHAEVTQAANRASARFAGLLQGVVQRW